MTSKPSRPAAPRRLAWRLRTAVVTAAAGGLAAAMAGVSAAQPLAPAHAAARHASKSAVVVHEARRHGFGLMLVTTTGRALYILPHGSCTGPCLTVWPRLAMPAGATIPKGAPCLRTAPFAGGRQVTYHGKRLYTFISDHGHSVTGNGVSGFKVAKVTARCR